MFVFACVLTFAGPWAITQIVSRAASVQNPVDNYTLGYIVLLVNTLMIPLYLLETKKMVDEQIKKERSHKRVVHDPGRLEEKA